MKNRDFHITSRSFSIPITMDEYDVIDHNERLAGSTEVGEMLAEIPGVYDVDYNGHFGLYIYLTIEKEYDNDQTLNAISEIINREGGATMYQIWGDDEAMSWTLTTRENAPKLHKDGLIELDAKLMLEFPAVTYQEAEVMYEKTLREWSE